MAAYAARQRAKSQKEKSLSKDIKMKIELDGDSSTEIFTSFDKISGNVTLVNRSNPARVIEVQDVKIWLEGSVITRFKAKDMDGKSEDRMQYIRFLPDTDDSDGDGVTYDIIRRDESKEKRSLAAGTHKFPFDIQLNGEILPCSLNAPFARIQYRLILYIQLVWGIALKLSKCVIMTTKGCYNLNIDQSLANPIVVSKTKEKSFFSSRAILTGHLVMAQRGFLPGEDLNFQLNIENFTGQQISRLSVSLVQRNNYYVQKNSKRTTEEILGAEETSCDTKDAEIRWEGLIPIPRNLMPSFSRPNKKSVDILYIVLFSVDTAEPALLKGEAPITIGTSRDPIPQMAANSKGGEKGEAFSGTGDQVDGNPPPYSALSSRRTSLRLLPPPYEEIFEEGDDWCT